MGNRTGHTSFQKGKRLRVKLRNGRVFFDRFVEREGRFVRLEDHGRIRTQDIDVMSLAKGPVVYRMSDGGAVVICDPDQKIKIWSR